MKATQIRSTTSNGKFTVRIWAEVIPPVKPFPADVGDKSYGGIVLCCWLLAGWHGNVLKIQRMCLLHYFENLRYFFFARIVVNTTSFILSWKKQLLYLVTIHSTLEIHIFLRERDHEIIQQRVTFNNKHPIYKFQEKTVSDQKALVTFEPKCTQFICSNHQTNCLELVLRENASFQNQMIKLSSSHDLTTYWFNAQNHQRQGCL